MITHRAPAVDGYDGGPVQQRPIQHLAEVCVDFEVPVWTGTNQVWAPATARMERNVDILVALEIAGTKYKVSEDHKWLVHGNTPAMYKRAHTVSRFDGLVFVRSADLKIGDRVFLPASNASRKPSEADKLTGLGFAPVSKMRIQKLSEPVPVYCLTVPKHHSFILPSGIVSSNCHINSLLLSLFYRYLPDLYERGMIYVANSPEFYAKHASAIIIGDTVSMVQERLKKAGAPASVDVRHIKGWGEIKAPLMRMLAMDPQTRRLIKIKAIEIEDRTDFVRLMNDDVEYRRDMLGLPKGAAEATPDPDAKPVEDKEPRTRKAPVNKAKTKPVKKAA